MNVNSDKTRDDKLAYKRCVCETAAANAVRRSLRHVPRDRVNTLSDGDRR